MADIRSRPSTDTYRTGWDRVFGKPPKVTQGMKDDVKRAVERHADSLLRQAFAEDFPNTWGSRRPTESLDSHPAAD